MEKIKKGKIGLFQFENLGRFGQIGHFISTRKGGESKKPFESLNLGLHVGDDPHKVLQNRLIVADRVGLEPENFIFCKQTHSPNVFSADQKDRGRGAFEFADAIDDADALITSKSGMCLTVQVADCVPILLFDPIQEVVGTVHAGWRGTMAQISKNTVEKMRQQFGCNPADIVAGIGPAIGPCCYEITDKKLLRKWEEKYQTKDKVVVARGEKKFLDLWQANKIQLLRAGVKEDNIEIARICTACNTHEFFSYKKEGVTGRFGAGIVLNVKCKVKVQSEKFKARGGK